MRVTVAAHPYHNNNNKITQYNLQNNKIQMAFLTDWQVVW